MPEAGPDLPAVDLFADWAADATCRHCLLAALPATEGRRDATQSVSRRIEPD